MNNIILIGAGGHARSCIEIIEMNSLFKIAGIVEKEGISNDRKLNYPIIGSDKDLESLRKNFKFVAITIGQLKSANIRKKLFEKVIKLKFELPIIVSPRAYVSKNCHVGIGTIIMNDVFINSNSYIGNNCIINNKALIEHDAKVGNHCHISTGAIINGGVKIGNQSFIGSGAITKHMISIGKNCVIGAGVIIKNNIEANQIIKN